MTTPPPFVPNELTHALRSIVEQHGTDATFNVTRLVHLSRMSRTDPHRKLRNYTGMSASVFVRYGRVQRAKELLVQHPDWTVC